MMLWRPMSPAQLIVAVDGAVVLIPVGAGVTQRGAAAQLIDIKGRDTRVAVDGIGVETRDAEGVTGILWPVHCKVIEIVRDNRVQADAEIIHQVRRKNARVAGRIVAGIGRAVRAVGGNIRATTTLMFCQW